MIAIVASCLACGLACGDADVNSQTSGGAAAAGTGVESRCAEYAYDVSQVRLGLESAGDGARVIARLAGAQPLPPEKYLNAWTVDFVNPAGTAIDDVSVTMARAFMPVHGHDGTFPPIVTKLAEPGRVQIDDLNLWMRGPWLIQLGVSSPTVGEDYIEFSVCVEE